MEQKQSLLWESIKGNLSVKRAIEIALVGNHTLAIVACEDADRESMVEVASDLGLTCRGSGPCPCGFYTHKTLPCVCTIEQIAAYMGNILPVLTKTDIVVYAHKPKYKELSEIVEPLHYMLVRVKEARAYNVEKTGLSSLDKPGDTLLAAAYDKLPLTARQLAAVLRVAQSIARLARTKCIESSAIAEAIQYTYRLN